LKNRGWTGGVNRRALTIYACAFTTLAIFHTRNRAQLFDLVGFCTARQGEDKVFRSWALATFATEVAAKAAVAGGAMVGVGPPDDEFEAGAAPVGRTVVCRWA
jgi:hypothetical protein